MGSAQDSKRERMGRNYFTVLNALTELVEKAQGILFTHDLKWTPLFGPLSAVVKRIPSDPLRDKICQVNIAIKPLPSSQGHRILHLGSSL